RYRDNGSVSVSLPTSTSSRSAGGVDCLDTEAMSNTVRVVIVLPVDMSATPRTPVQTTLPWTPTAAEHPGAPTSMVSFSTFWLRVTAASWFVVLLGVAFRPPPQALSD